MVTGNEHAQVKQQFTLNASRVDPITGAVEFSSAAPAEVHGRWITSLCIYHKIGIVPQETWELHVKCPCDKSKTNVSNHFGLDGLPCAGVVMLRSSIPPELSNKYYPAKLSYEHQTLLNRTAGVGIY